jgi:hypothetical protein
MVAVRFIELVPPRKIVEAVSFVTTDPAFFGEMTIEVTFKRCPTERRSSSCAGTCRRACGQRTTKPARDCLWSSWPAASTRAHVDRP